MSKKPKATVIYLQKIGPDLYRAVDNGLDKVRVGDFIMGKTTPRTRNPRFHAKWWSLIRYAFDLWVPKMDEIKIFGRFGRHAEKNLERFRKDVIVSTGHYELVVNIKNEVRAEAESIAFDQMEEGEFNDVYEKTITVLLHDVLENYTREDINRVVDNLLSYA